jgi:hypothetical protein
MIEREREKGSLESTGPFCVIKRKCHLSAIVLKHFHFFSYIFMYLARHTQATVACRAFFFSPRSENKSLIRLYPTGGGRLETITSPREVEFASYEFYV